MTTSGKQPLFSDDNRYVLAANGEIYNHREIRNKLKSKYLFKTNSDCEVILALFKEKGKSFLDDMNGIFAFAIYDTIENKYFIARDHLGIIPLYIGWDANGTFYVSSELKSLESNCVKLNYSLGHYLSSDEEGLKNGIPEIRIL